MRQVADNVDIFDELAPVLVRDERFRLNDKRRLKDFSALTEKQCAKCGETTPINNFSKVSQRYFAAYCKKCTRDVAKREYNSKRKERIAEIRAWRAKNPDKTYLYHQRWWAKKLVKIKRDQCEEGKLICWQCRLALPATTDYFYKKSGREGELRSHCRECCSTWSIKNRKRLKMSKRAAMEIFRQKVRAERAAGIFKKRKRLRKAAITLCSPRNKEIKMNKIFLHHIIERHDIVDLKGS